MGKKNDMDNGGNFLGGVLHSMCKCRKDMLVLGLCRSAQVELVRLVLHLVLKRVIFLLGVLPIFFFSYLHSSF